MPVFSLSPVINSVSFPCKLRGRSLLVHSCATATHVFSRGICPRSCNDMHLVFMFLDFLFTHMRFPGFCCAGNCRFQVKTERHLPYGRAAVKKKMIARLFVSALSLANTKCSSPDIKATVDNYNNEMHWQRSENISTLFSCSWISFSPT